MNDGAVYYAVEKEKRGDCPPPKIIHDFEKAY